MSEDQAVAIAELKKDVEALNKEVQTLTEQVKGLLEAWNTATGVVRFVKWLSGLAAAILGLVGFFKGWYK